MITHVLDTSALLAHYLREPGADDVNAILADVADLAAAHKMRIEDVEDVVLADLLAEQPLPVGSHR